MYMKYGEITLSSIYLLFLIISGIVLLINNKKSKTIKLMGLAALILGLGDSVHLVPRCLAYFLPNNLDLYLGVGKLVTSITMTIFYIVVLYILKEISHKKYNAETVVIYLLAICRIVLCALPENNWLTNKSPFIYEIIRNVPFLFIGIIMIKLLINNRKIPYFKFLWLFVLLSFGFYTATIIGAHYIELLGVLMIPKTICYLLIVLSFDCYSSTILRIKNLFSFNLLG